MPNTAKLRLNELQPGMKLVREARCLKKFCPKHDENDLILEEDTILTQKVIKVLRENIDCFFNEAPKTFAGIEELNTFINDIHKNKNAMKGLKVIERDRGGRFLSILTIAQLKALIEVYGPVVVERLSLLYGEDPVFHVEVDSKEELRRKAGSAEMVEKSGRISEREVDLFKSNLRNRTKEIYRTFEENVDKGMPDLPEKTVEDVFNIVSEAGEFFHRLVGSGIEDHLITARDAIFEDTYSHSCAVALLAAKIIQSIGTMDIFLQPAFAACLFIDSGIIYTKSKGKSFKEHPVFAANLYRKVLEKISRMSSADKHGNEPMVKTANSLQVSLKMGIPLITNHHERNDGSGYPVGNTSHTHNMELDRLIGMIDEFFNLTGAIDYHSDGMAVKQHAQMSNAAALNELKKQTEQGKFFKKHFELLEKHIPLFPLYSLVELSDGRKAIVIDLRRNKKRPIVYTLDTCETVDLTLDENRKLSIVEKAVNETKNVSKAEIPVKIGYISENDSMEVELRKPRDRRDNIVYCPCSGDKHILLTALPMEIADEYKLGNCLHIRKKFLTCENGHFCILTLEPPEDCAKLTCDTPSKCPIQGWKLFVEGFQS